jgi:hypothetical protein
MTGTTNPIDGVVLPASQGGLGFTDLSTYGALPTAPMVVVMGDGQNASAYANVDGNGTVSSITPGNHGGAYTQVQVLIVGGGGSGASYTGNIVGGSVTSYTKNSGGTGYYNTATATNNITQINAALTANRQVQISIPGRYDINDHILVNSFNTLWCWPGVEICKVASMPGNVCLIRNANMLATNPDHDIQILGGRWNGRVTGNGGNSGSDKSGDLLGVLGDTSFIGVKNLVLRGMEVIETYHSIQFCGTNILLENIVISSQGDGLHMSGNTSNVTIRRVTGYTGDDLIELGAWDWVSSSPSRGPITDIFIEDIDHLGGYNNNGSVNVSSFIKFLSGTDAQTSILCNIKNVQCRGLKSAGGGINFISDFDQITQTYNGGYSGAGLVQDVLIDGFTYNNPGGLPIGCFLENSPTSGQVALTLQDITINKFDSGPSNSVVMFFSYALANALQVDNFEITNSAFNPTASNFSFFQINTPNTLKRFKIEGVTIYSPNPSNYNPIAYIQSGTTIGHLEVNGLKTVTGTTITDPLITVASGGTVTLLVCKDWDLDGSGSNNQSGIYIIGSVPNIVAERINMRSLWNGLYLNNSSSNQQVHLTDCVMTGMGIPIYAVVSIAVTVIGGRIDSGNEVARCDVNGAVLSLNLQGVQLTGSGASTYATANGGVINVKQDGIYINQQTANGSSSGSAVFSQPAQGSTYKKAIIYLNALNGTASYTFPTPFTHTPTVGSTNGLATTKVTSLSTSSVTVTGSTDTGILYIEGY